MRRILRGAAKGLGWSLVLLSISSCNIFSSLQTGGATKDILELALQCLHNRDYAGAITYYNLLPAGALKSEKLCSVYMSRGGVTLPVLLNTVMNSGNSMIIDLAESLLPWSQTKEDDLVTAVAHCDNMVTLLGGTVGKALMLKTLGRFARCAMMVGKTDHYKTNADGGSCTYVANTPNGRVNTTDVAADAITPQPGMCKQDAATCVADFTELQTHQVAGDYTAAHLDTIGTAVAALPDNTTDDTLRLGLFAVAH